MPDPNAILNEVGKAILLDNEANQDNPQGAELADDAQWQDHNMSHSHFFK